MRTLCQLTVVIGLAARPAVAASQDLAPLVSGFAEPVAASLVLDYPTAPQEQIDPYKLSDEVKTTASKFLKPTARGRPLSVFFLTPTNYDREIIELAQRADIRFQTTFYANRAFKGAAGERLAGQLSEGRPECLVMSAIFWDSFSPQLRKQVLTLVSRGMGLVYIDPFRLDKPIDAAMKLEPLAPDGVVRGIPLEAMGLVAENGPPEKWIQCARFGKGRIVFIKHQVRLYKRGWDAGLANFIPRARPKRSSALQELPYRQDSLDYFERRCGLPADPFRTADEYGYAFVIRAMHWAASREPECRIEKVEVGPDAKAVVTITGDAANYRLSVRAHDRFGNTVATLDAVSLRNGKAQVELEDLNSGRHFLDVRLKDDGGRIADFYTIVFDAPANPVAITAFAPQQAYFAGDTKPTFDLTLTNNTPRNQPVRLRLSLTDGWGRTLARETKTLDPAPGWTTLTWQTTRPPVCGSFLFRADLSIDDSGEQAACIITFPDDDRYPDEFTAQFWGGPSDKERDWLRLAREQGFRGAHVKAFEGAAGGMRTAVEHFIPLYVRRPADAEGKRRENNLNEPDYREFVNRMVDAKVRISRPMGLHGYSLGHEASLSHVESSTYVADYDFSPHTLAKFRTWLEAKYDTIEELNEAWDTRHRRFDDVTPRTYKEIAEHKTNLAPWMEHRKFMDANFTGWLTDCARRIRRIDPPAKVGITGIPGGGFGSFLGIDTFQQAQQLDYTVLYSKKRVLLKLRLACRRPGQIVGVFTGYDSASPNKVYNRTEAWRYLFLGCTEISYYLFNQFGAGGQLAGYFAPDMTLSPSGRWLGQSLREITAGPDKLLFDKPRRHHGVGIYFSQPNIHATTGLDMAVFLQLDGQLDAMLHNLELYGLAPRILSHYEVLQHPACLDEFKVLFVPVCVSLSQTEIKALAAFVEKGGTLVVDPLLGLYDENGRFAADRLADWFGPAPADYLRHFNSPTVVRAEAGLALAGAEQRVELSAFKGAIRRLRGARPVEGIRFTDGDFTIESARIGKGRVVNMTFFAPPADAMALWLRRQVSQWGVRPGVEVVDAAGRLVPQVAVSEIAGNGKTYYGIVYSSWTERYKKIRAQLKWASPAHAYDVRAHRSLGRVDSLAVTLDPMEPLLLCLFAEPIAAFSCSLGGDAVRRGSDVEVTIVQPKGPRLLYRVELMDPDGKTSVPFIKKVWGQDRTLIRFPMAYNDALGTWTVRVAEVISGRSVSKEIRVVE